MNGFTISFRLDPESGEGGNIAHDNREFIAKNVDPDRVVDNIIYNREDVQTAYEKLFGEALDEYNTKQKQPCRRIKNYYEHIKNSKREELFYSAIVAFGDKDTAACGTSGGELTKKLLDEYMREFQKRNPNLYVFNAVMHLDESEPHLHIKFVPFVKAKDGEKCNSLRIRVSMRSALIAEGFAPSNPTQNQQTLFCNHERDNAMTEILQKHGLERIIKGKKRTHLPIEDFRRVAALKELLSTGNALLKRSITENQIKKIQRDFFKNTNGRI